MVIMLVEQDLGYRKIQRTGRESYIISLPKEWVLTIGLNKGDQLAFKKQDSSLLLVPRKVLEGRDKTKESSLKEFTVHITSRDDPQSISRRIMSLYEVSADLINIRFKEGEITPKQKASIKNTSKMLLGSEVIAESPNEISIQVLIEHPKFPIEKAIRRMFAVARSMDQDAVSVLENLDERRIQGVIDSDDDLDRLNLYVVRQLKYGIEHNLFKEMGFRSPKEFLGYRIVAKNLENVGDNAVGTAKNILSLKRLIDEQILTLTKPIDEEAYSSVIEFNSIGHRLLEDSLKALFKRDYHLADEIISKFTSTCFNLEKDAVNLILNKKLDPNVTLILRLILDNARKMMEYSRDIAEVTLNRTVEETNEY
jgi:phosphate uptake regulator